MPRTKNFQTNFSAGELAPELGARQDTDQYRNGAKSLLNRRCLIGGGTVRRPGSWWLVSLAGPSRLAEWVVNRTTQYIIVFSNGRMDAYLRNVTTGLVTLADSITSAPWTGDIWQEMQWVQSGNTMFLVHEDMPMQVITRDSSAGTFSRAALSFATGPASRPEQPYLKFAPAAMTLTASDVSGSITLTTSADWFTDDHVDQYIRYVGKACQITAVTDAQNATATVIETLPETQDLTVGSSSLFAVGEVVEGDSTGAKGLITSIPDGTSVVIVQIEKLIAFTSSDDLIGPQATTTISSVANVTNAAVTDWDEQMAGPVYGYFGTVELHRNRLLLAAHKTAPDYLAGSSNVNLYDFNVGDASDSDGFLESVGDDAAARIVQLHSAEQLLVATDNGMYYVPEGQSNALRPTSIAFFPFGSPWPISENVRHHPFDNGVIITSGSLVIKASPTGDVNRSWDSDEVSLLSSHLVTTPTDMAVTSNYAGGPERYGLFRNSDGSLAVMQLVEKQNIRNFTPWAAERETDTYRSVAAIDDDIYVATIRNIAGNTVYILELFDQDITLDAATEYTLATDMDDASSGVQSRYGSTEVQVVSGTQALGTYPLTQSVTPEGPFTVGLFYDSEIEILPPIVQGREGDEAGEYLRILEAFVHVRNSARFAADGHELAAYQVNDDLSEAPSLKTGPQHFEFLGWEQEPTITITQPDPLPLEVLGIKTTVAY